MSSTTNTPDPVEQKALKGSELHMALLAWKNKAITMIELKQFMDAHYAKLYGGDTGASELPQPQEEASGKQVDKLSDLVATSEEIASLPVVASGPPQDFRKKRGWDVERRKRSKQYQLGYHAGWTAAKRNLGGSDE